MIAERKLFTLSRLALVAAMFFVVACGPGGESAVSRSNAAMETAPEFTLPTVQGDEVSLSDFAGQVRLVDFWATWCAPCKEEIPMFKELHELYGDKGFTILAISDENGDIVRGFVEAGEIPYTNLVDPGEVSTSYGVVSLPTAFLLDREGNIVEEFRGTKPRRILEGKIRELLDLPGDA